MKKNKKGIPCKDGNVIAKIELPHPLESLFKGVQIRHAAKTKPTLFAIIEGHVQQRCKEAYVSAENVAVATIEQKNRELAEKDEQIERLKRAVRHISKQNAEEIITAVCDPSHALLGQQFMAGEAKAPRRPEVARA